MKQRPGDFCCIAIDMGAGSIRVMLGTIGEGKLHYREIHRVQNRIVYRNGHDRWDMERITGAIHTGIRKSLGSHPENPVSIGVDSWGVDFVHLDREGKLAESPVAYRDQRTEGMREEWAALMSEEETFRRTGINFYIFNTLFQLLSIRGTEIMERTGRILFMPCFINYLLSGRAVNEVTIASTSQLMRLMENEWDEEILRNLGLKKELLGQTVMPGSLLGKVTLPEFSSSGMQNVAVCGHDTACVVAALPADREDYAYISAGTWCIVGIETTTPLVGERALRLGFTNEKGYDGTYRALKNIVGLWLLQGLKQSLPEGTTYSDMEQMTLGGGEVTQVIDPDDGRFYNPGDMKEAFDAYFRESGQPVPTRFSHYLRCAYDSICFSIRYHIEQLEELSGRRIGVLHLTGGGSRSPYLNRRIATICGKQVVSGPAEGAVLGNILVQAMAMGRIGSLAEGRTLVRNSSGIIPYEPEPGETEIHKRYEFFLNLKHQ